LAVVHAVVRKSYRSAYSAPLKVRRGEKLAVLERQSEWPGWEWCVNEAGLGGWVPRSYIEEAKGRWRMRVDYEATELTVDKGEVLVINGEESGWLLCTNSRDQKGWVPRSHLAVTGGDSQAGVRVTTPTAIVAAGTQDVETVRMLFREYAGVLGFDLCFQDFDQELAMLPGRYSPPDGVLMLALAMDALHAAAGCVALRRFGANICELKRLYVRPAYRGSGLGRRLVGAVISQARELGYRRMRLDTVPSMNEAIALYRSVGFVEIAPCRNNPVQGAIFMELEL